MTQPKIAIVTGAGTGIGKAAALALLNDGWHVALAGRREQPLKELAQESGRASQCLVLPTDVANPDAVKALFAETAKTWGRVDLLFNNAGVGAPPVPLDELTIEQWRNVVDINLNGMFYCLQQAFAIMKKQQPMGGRIINNGSISAYAPRPNSIAYTSTKHAVTGLTKTAALDGRAFSIAVGQIDIGNAGTEMAAPMARGVKQANGDVKPEPLMDVAHVGESILYMANLPLSANVLFHTVMATNMPFVGRG
ncbi:MAG: SDR family oxidoreductase [Limnohabitans sp.]|jgi:NAD(P)-dependent dehydrogenase (short-subunit alcohol dehydrogenase family)|nr:SDR family oxidoreductase [Limnohabitans sp.]